MISKLSVCIFVLGLAGTSSAASSSKGTNAKVVQEKASTLSSEDVQTLAKLHHINQMEIEVGGLAKTSGGTSQVKSFGERLVKDHTASDKQVLALAKDNGVELSEPQPKDEADKEKMAAHAATGEKLKTLKGKEFDETFLPAMVQGHEDAISLVTAARTETQDAKMGALLDKTLPVLKEHLKIAQGLSHGGPGASSK